MYVHVEGSDVVSKARYNKARIKVDLSSMLLNFEERVGLERLKRLAFNWF